MSFKRTFKIFRPLMRKALADNLHTGDIMTLVSVCKFANADVFPLVATVNQRDLCADTSLSPGAVSSSLKKLTALGYIQKSKSGIELNVELNDVKKNYVKVNDNFTSELLASIKFTRKQEIKKFIWNRIEQAAHAAKRSQTEMSELNFGTVVSSLNTSSTRALKLMEKLQSYFIVRMNHVVQHVTRYVRNGVEATRSVFAKQEKFHFQLREMSGAQTTLHKHGGELRKFVAMTLAEKGVKLDASARNLFSYDFRSLFSEWYTPLAEQEQRLILNVAKRHLMDVISSKSEKVLAKDAVKIVRGELKKTVDKASNELSAVLFPRAKEALGEYFDAYGVARPVWLGKDAESDRNQMQFLVRHNQVEFEEEVARQCSGLTPQHKEHIERAKHIDSFFSYNNVF